MNIYDIVTKDYIKERVSDEDIFYKYLGIYPEVNEPFCNPFREDSNPDCYFYVNKYGILYFKDFAGGIHWDCFNVVQFLYDCSFKKALLIIANDFNLVNFDTKHESTLPKRINVQREIIRYEYRVTRESLDQFDYNYWESFGITKDTLYHFRVAKAKKVWIKKSTDYNFRVRTYYSRTNPCYVYQLIPYEYCYKFYYPYAKGNNIPKFLSSGGKVVEGYDLLPDEGEFVVITKSYKDVMAMYEFGIPAIAPSSETSYSEIEEIIPDLENRFTYIFILMDWDRAGQRFSIYFRKKYQFQVFSFKSKMPKDFSDHIRYYGYDWMQEKLDQIRRKYLL